MLGDYLAKEVIIEKTEKKRLDSVKGRLLKLQKKWAKSMENTSLFINVSTVIDTISEKIEKINKKNAKIFGYLKNSSYICIMKLKQDRVL